MKKLMFAAVVCSALTGLCIESNVVGYSPSQLQENAKLITPQFLTIGASADSFALQDFKPKGEGFVDKVFICQLNDLGGKVASYVWIDYAGEEGTDECWADGETYDWPDPAVYFGPGDGLWVEAKSSDQSLVGSGAVSTSDVLVQLQNNATLTGNPFPTSLPLQDIAPIGDGFVDKVFICKLNDLGGKIASYVWIDYAGEGEDECWADGETYDWPDPAVTFEPGEGLWVEAKSNTQYLQIPAPEL